MTRTRTSGLARALALAIATVILTACGPTPPPTADPFDAGTPATTDSGTPTCTPQGSATDSALPVCPPIGDPDGGALDGGNFASDGGTPTDGGSTTDTTLEERAHFFDVEADGRYFAIINGENDNLDMTVERTAVGDHNIDGECASGWKFTNLSPPRLVCLDPMTGNLSYHSDYRQVTGKIWACDCAGFENATSGRVCRDLNGPQENCTDPSGNPVLFKAEISIGGAETFNSSYFQLGNAL